VALAAGLSLALGPILWFETTKANNKPLLLCFDWPKSRNEATHTSVAKVLEEYRKIVVTCDLGFDSVFPNRQKWSDPDAGRLETLPTSNAWPTVLGPVDTDPGSFRIVRQESELTTAVNGPNAFMIPLDSNLTTDVNAYATLLFLKGIAPRGTVIARSYTSLVCIGSMKGRLNFDSYATALVKGDVSGKIASESYFNLVITGKFSGRILAKSYSMIYLLEGCNGDMELRNYAKVYIAGRTTEADLKHITGKGKVYLEQSDLRPGEHQIGDLHVTVAGSTRSANPSPPKSAGVDNATDFGREGWRLWMSGQANEAVGQFEKALKLNPSDANTWNGLGWACFNAGKWRRAEEAFKKTIDLQPDHPAANNGLGQLYFAQAEFDRAKTYLLTAAPNAPAAWYGLAKLCLLQGEFEEAERWAQQIVDRGEGEREALSAAKEMLQAAKEEHLGEGLRLLIQPTTKNTEDNVSKPTTEKDGQSVTTSPIAAPPNARTTIDDKTDQSSPLEAQPSPTSGGDKEQPKKGRRNSR
jgi:tetratricopeptide (TPR) repeat protein